MTAGFLDGPNEMLLTTVYSFSFIMVKYTWWFLDFFLGLRFFAAWALLVGGCRPPTPPGMCVGGLRPPHPPFPVGLRPPGTPEGRLGPKCLDSRYSSMGLKPCYLLCLGPILGHMGSKYFGPNLAPWGPMEAEGRLFGGCGAPR